MSNFLSAGVRFNEIDLTNIIPSVSTTDGAFVSQANWGPIDEVVLLTSEDDLRKQFGKPDSSNYENWFTAANFLSYSNKLWFARVADSTNANTSLLATNATISNTSGVLVKNDTVYDDSFSDGSLKSTYGAGEFIAKYAGSLGNTLKVSVCASANAFSKTLTGTLSVTAGTKIVTGSGTDFVAQTVVGDFLTINGEQIKVASIANTTSLTLSSNHIAGASSNVAVQQWEFYNSVSGAPTTSVYAEALGGSNDEMHVVVIDEDGLFTGTKNSVLEVFDRVSKASDAKLDDGTTNYYKDVVNSNSKYIRWAGHSNNIANVGNTASGTSFGTYLVPVTSSFVGGNNGTTANNASVINGYDLFKNSEDVDISIVLTGNYSLAVLTYVISNIVEYRKDCVVVLSPPKSVVVNNKDSAATDIVNFRNTLPSSSYAIMDSGWKKQYDKYSDVVRTVPLNGDIGGVIANSDLIANPWFSPAGYNRGNVKNVIALTFNPNKADRDTLYKNGVNPVTSEKGDGVTLQGDKTLLSKPSAFDRINVRRLFIVLRKSISKASKYMLFEFNDVFTRTQFKNMVEPYLRDIQGKRGIFEFRVVCDTSNNTPEVIDTNQFVADIYIKPARSINFITINAIATRTGVEFTEIVGKF